MLELLLFTLGDQIDPYMLVRGELNQDIRSTRTPSSLVSSQKMIA